MLLIALLCAGAAFQHVLTASTVTHDQSELSIVPHHTVRLPYVAYEPGLIARLLGVVLATVEAAHAYGVRLLRIYM